MNANLSAGYGIHVAPTPALKKAIEEQIDLEFILDDNFPLLSLGIYGNSHEVNELVLVKSSLIEPDNYFLDMENSKGTIQEDEMFELQRFCAEYHLEYSPRWLSFMTVFP